MFTCFSNISLAPEYFVAKHVSHRTHGQEEPQKTLISSSSFQRLNYCRQMFINPILEIFREVLQPTIHLVFIFLQTLTFLVRKYFLMCKTKSLLLNNRNYIASSYIYYILSQPQWTQRTAFTLYHWDHIWKCFLCFLLCRLTNPKSSPNAIMFLSLLVSFPFLPWSLPCLSPSYLWYQSWTQCSN